MITSIIPTYGVNDISPNLLMENGYLKLLPAEFYHNLNWNDFRVFCHKYARYGIITIELAEFLNKIIDCRPVIEIGAGAGDFGYHLKIHMTDSKQQEDPEIKAAYATMRQPVIKYPKEIEKIDVLDAVYKHKPKVVLGSWITTYAPYETSYGSNPYGIRESNIISHVETFILIGNVDTHGDKPIMKLSHEEFYFDWLVSRGKNQENNRIWIWNKK
jgi:hypothetical protein